MIIETNYGVWLNRPIHTIEEFKSACDELFENSPIPNGDRLFYVVNEEGDFSIPSALFYKLNTSYDERKYNVVIGFLNGVGWIGFVDNLQLDTVLKWQKNVVKYPLIESVIILDDRKHVILKLNTDGFNIGDAVSSNWLNGVEGYVTAIYGLQIVVELLENKMPFTPKSGLFIVGTQTTLEPCEGCSVNVDTFEFKNTPRVNH